MLSSMVFQNQMLLEVFDTHLGAQGMKIIFELWHYLSLLFLRCGPSHLLVFLVINRVVFFLDHIQKQSQLGSTPYILDSSVEISSQ